VSLTYTAPSRSPLGFLPLLASEYTSRTKNSNGVLQIRLSCRREGGKEGGRESQRERDREGKKEGAKRKQGATFTRERDLALNVEGVFSASET